MKLNNIFIIKGTLMQNWKSPYMLVFLQEQYPENFSFLILKILELFSVKFVNFLKSRLIFVRFYCFVNKLSHISSEHISKSKRCFNVKSSTYYFHVKTKILPGFQICISVPWRLLWYKSVLNWGWGKPERFVEIFFVDDVIVK